MRRLFQESRGTILGIRMMQFDIVILMLGSNDLKENFHLSASEIADGAGVLVETIQSFTAEKQGYVPKIVLRSPPEIGEGITVSLITKLDEHPDWDDEEVADDVLVVCQYFTDFLTYRVKKSGTNIKYTLD